MGTLDTPLRYFQDWTHTSVALSLTESRAILLPLILGAQHRDSMVYLKGLAPNHFGPWDLVDEDVPPPVPPKYISLKPKKSASNEPAWSRVKRKQSHSILVTSYLTGQLEFRYQNGFGSCKDFSRNQYPTSLKTCGLFTEVWETGPDGNKYPFYQVGGYKMYDASFYRGYRWRSCSSYTGNPYDYGWNDDLIVTALKNIPLEIDKSLVTECTANANTGTLDLLTTIAEAPEALKSALKGCTEIMRMYKDARTKNLRLLNKAKLKQIEFDKWSSMTYSQKLDAKKMALAKQKSDSFKQAIKDLLTAASGVWLNYRLNILPTAGAVEDSLKGLEQLGLETYFQRFRESSTNTMSMLEHLNLPSGWALEQADLSVLERVLVKRGVSGSQKWTEIFSTNVFKTAWELVPLSFVVDRYMSIGSLLSAAYPPGTNVLEGATFSWKIDDAIQFVHRQSGAAVNVRISYYKRLVINPSNYLCIPFPKTRSRDQSLDHLALLWNLVIKNLWKV